MQIRSQTFLKCSMERRSSISHLRCFIDRTEMVKFEPDAMRALVKYKMLKKLIGKCIDRRDRSASASRDVPAPSEQDVKDDAVAMQTSDSLFPLTPRFIEDLISDVIEGNQYYNKKFDSIRTNYLKYLTDVQVDLNKVEV